MEPLITIETVPIEIKFVKKEPLKLSAVNSTQVSVAQEDGKKSITSNPIRIPIQDSFKPSSAYNWDHSTYTATADYGEDGNLNLNIQMEDGDAKAIRFEQSTRDINAIAGLLPTTVQSGNDEQNNMEISFNMSGLSSSTSTADNTGTQFYPPDLELVVTQRPDVIIKYVGGPIYVPPSSNPDYKPIEGVGPLYVPLSAAPDYKPVAGSTEKVLNEEGQKLDQRV
ncbi:hypothetical protein [Acetobacterium tundrae]|uniref:Uncharacterized protein n=1 Tax=Acetobacterium tundrae TaxID=132932 RepID=A0ABR6WLM0_9FIRM|nr:hypothetical protein [Acetobacterium tundrae]MBC3797065.1 hypothetical protein [Acetobacterium tundrae]